MYKGLGKWILFFSLLLAVLLIYNFRASKGMQLVDGGAGIYDYESMEEMYNTDFINTADDYDEGAASASSPSYNAMQDGQLQQFDPHVH